MNALRSKAVLILVENLSVPFDRRVWLEATTLRDAGYRVSVICPRGKKRDTEEYVHIDGIAIYRYTLPATTTSASSYVREYGVALLHSLRLSIKVRRERGFHVIQGCNPPDLFFLLALLYRPLGVRFVFDHHDLSPETFRAQFGRRLAPLYRLLLLLERYTLRTAHTIITTNESLRQVAIKRGGVDPQRVFVVRTGPDFKRLHPVPVETTLRRGFRYLVAYLGVMGAQDGVDLALCAASMIVHEWGHRDVGFVLIGDGDQAPVLRDLCSTLQLDDYVEFTGRVSDEDLVRYLAAADVCVSPDPANNLNEFHTMNKTMEYMAMGKPAVAFDLKETRVSAQGAATYARPNDVSDLATKLLELLADPERRAEMGRIGLARVKAELLWEHSQPALLAAYAHALDGLRDMSCGPEGPCLARAHVVG